MIGVSDTILGAAIGAVSGFLGLLIGLMVNSILEKRRNEREKFKDIRSRLIGERLLASEVMEFIKSQRKIKLRFLSWQKLNKKLQVLGWRIGFFDHIRSNNLFRKLVDMETRKDERQRPDMSWAKLQGIKLRMQDLSNVIL